jgi:anti-sigma regulatory factor (Ser/Thr protein kinase)
LGVLRAASAGDGPTASVRRTVDTPLRLRRLLDDLGSLTSVNRLGDLRLLVHELVTNSIRHADGSVRLRIAASDGQMRVEVGDDHPAFEPHVVPPAFGQSSGMGLFLVDQLADRWGVVETGAGKIAWFELGTNGRAGDVTVPGRTPDP